MTHSTKLLCVTAAAALFLTPLSFAQAPGPDAQAAPGVAEAPGPWAGQQRVQERLRPGKGQAQRERGQARGQQRERGAVIDRLRERIQELRAKRARGSAGEAHRGQQGGRRAQTHGERPPMMERFFDQRQGQQRFGRQRGQQFGQKFDQKFGQQRGQQFGQQRGQRFGQNFGQNFGQQRGPRFGQQQRRTFQAPQDRGSRPQLRPRR